MGMTRGHDLAKLIDQVKDDQGWSDEDLARNARSRGRKMSKQHIANLRTQNPLKTLVPGTLYALADALGLPPERVIEAALPSAGLPLPSAPADWSVETAIRVDSTLTGQSKRMLLTLLETAHSTDTATAEAPPPVVRPIRRAPQVPSVEGKAARKRQ